MKGMSEIVSAVLVLAVSISILSLYAEWAPGFTEGAVGEIADQSDREIKCSNAAVSVSDATYDRTGKIVEFDIENTGTIRLSRGVQAGAFSSSLELNRTVISELEVGETQTVRITADRAPEMILVSSRDCPDLETTENGIKVQK
jgi:hypothetical protein